MKINIGGESKKEGWKILNVQKKPNVDFIGNINNLDQFENECCDEIYASHVIEHIDQKTVLKTLKGINRILKKKWKILHFSTRYGFFVPFFY